MAAFPPLNAAIAAAPPFLEDYPVHINDGPWTVGLTFLGFQPEPALPGGQIRFSLPSWTMIYAFGSRLKFTRNPVSYPMVSQVTPLNLVIAGQAWDRIMLEYLTAGLLVGPPLTSMEGLRQRIGSLQIANAANLEIHAADLANAQPFIIPGGAGAAAQAAATALSQVRFLSLVKVIDLEAPGFVPWDIVSDLAGMLGPVSNNAIRSSEISQVQVAAVRIRGASTNITDGALASDLVSHAPALPPSPVSNLETREASLPWVGGIASACFAAAGAA